MRHHHNHDLDDVHYDFRSHDDIDTHLHIFEHHDFTVFYDDCEHRAADDHDIATGADHDHPGYDITHRTHPA